MFEQVRVTVVSDEVGNRNVGEVGKLDHDTGRTGGKGGEGAEGIHEADRPSPTSNLSAGEVKGGVLKNQKGTLVTGGGWSVLGVETEAGARGGRGMEEGADRAIEKGVKGPFALSIVKLFNLCDKNVVRNPRAKLDFVIKI